MNTEANQQAENTSTQDDAAIRAAAVLELDNMESSYQTYRKTEKQAKAAIAFAELYRTARKKGKKIGIPFSMEKFSQALVVRAMAGKKAKPVDDEVALQYYHLAEAAHYMLDLDNVSKTILDVQKIQSEHSRTYDERELQIIQIVAVCMLNMRNVPVDASRMAELMISNDRGYYSYDNIQNEQLLNAVRSIKLTITKELGVKNVREY